MGNLDLSRKNDTFPNFIQNRGRCTEIPNVIYIHTNYFTKRSLNYPKYVNYVGHSLLRHKFHIFLKI